MRVKKAIYIVGMISILSILLLGLNNLSSYVCGLALGVAAIMSIILHAIIIGMIIENK